MKLQVSNIGKIKSAEVALDGITVLTGDNDTGKSTVGRILYCLFSTFHDAQDQISTQKKKYLRDYVVDTFRSSASSKTSRRSSLFLLRKQVSDILEKSMATDEPDEDVFRKSLLEISDSTDIQLPESEIDKLVARFRNIVSQTDEEVLTNMLENQFQAEFGTTSIASLHATDLPHVKLSIKDQNIVIKWQTLSSDPKVFDYIDLVKNIIYIDDPFILDSMGDRFFNEGVSHRMALLNMLSGPAKDYTSVSEIVVQKKLQPIMSRLQKVCDGQLSRSERGDYQYHSDTLNGSIPIKEVSTGIKSFLVLKQLILDGRLEENGIVVLDEPEVHLHPQWQIVFSELIVMLHQVFGINFLITTHSIDFLSAIEYFSKTYKIQGKCHYYLSKASKNDGFSTIQETTGHLDQAYAELSNPFLELTGRLEEEK